jgi:small nuclear ribonucleoprotein (snRNP)-like protein
MRTLKRIVALFFILSLAALSGKLIAGERHGAKLQVETKDGNKATGELIAVKHHSLLLMDEEKKAEIPINIADVKEIAVKGKTNASNGALL